ncbi:matrixin family metalloprotease [Fodinibius sp.]|uniref:matrixin family metalloprotease n=1 Tax=Fodinibius sp. TaxID=1872440 RepID=UPI002ACD547C|nr:matrixin family metalloprotease [Fodinibius sp.]MDZ7659133.1 matrixin family metalloprotease [Fodinibius sp.]
MNSKIYSALFVLTVFAGWLIFSNGSTINRSDQKAPSPCQDPLTYRLGDIDSRFDITQKELAKIMDEVEQLWESAIDKDLINLSQDGQVALNLIYSEEQKRTDAERQFSDRITAKEQQVSTVEREYKRLSDRYEKAEKDVRQTLNEYNSKISTYNQLAKEWEGKEASSKIIAKFKTLEQEISTLEASLKRKKKNLESLRERTNAKTEKLNNLIKEHNNLIAEYNDRFSKPRKFDQGRFVKRGENQAINIYQFGNRAQLKTVLAHEVGHALGLDHVDNPKSIMHNMMAKQNMANLQLTEEDISALKKQCDM